MKPKDLHLNTLLVADGKPAAVLSLPPDARYDAIAQRIQARVQECAGVTLPVRRDLRPPDALRETHVIALGNMATHPFIETLYRHYYTYLDLYYPGRGGHVLQSVHNPYGAGHNVILVGGSDDEGVAQAAEALVERLQPGKDLHLGWTMDLRLGEGLEPPPPGQPVRAWCDYGGDRPDTQFLGWNPLTIDLGLYYMTGNPAYIDDFRRLLFPKGDFDRRLFDGDRMFEDPQHPLATVYHYRSHITPLIWDLVEESPVFTEAEWQRVTDELFAWQKHLNTSTCEAFAAGKSLPDRHVIHEILCLWTGSRYFAYSDPHPVWQDRMRLAAEAFALSLATPASNTPRIATGTVILPILEFALYRGADEYFRPGGVFAQRMEKWLCLGDETEFEECSYLLLQAPAHVLQDGRFLSLRPIPPENRNRFRLGQSYLSGVPPTEITETTGLHGFPMAETNHRRLSMTTPLDESFEFLTYRSSLGPTKQHLFLYGYYEGSKSAPRVNCILNYEHAGVKVVRTSAENGVVVQKDGRRENAPSMSAACRRAEEIGSFAFARSVVPDHDFSQWERSLFFLKERCAVVFDRIVAREGGEYDVAVQWFPSGSATPDAGGLRWRTGARQCALLTADPVPVVQRGNRLDFFYRGHIGPGESRLFRSLLAAVPEGEVEPAIAPLGAEAAAVRANGVAIMGTGNLSQGPLQASGEAFLLAPDEWAVVRGTQLSVGAVGVQFSAPATWAWDLKSGDFVLKADGQDVTATFVGVAAGPVTCAAGQEVRGQAALPAAADLAATVTAAVDEALKSSGKSRTPARLPAMAEPSAVFGRPWQCPLDEAVTALEVVGEGEATRLLVGTRKGTATLLKPDGSPVWQFSTGGPVYALAGAEVERGAAPSPVSGEGRGGGPREALYLIGSDDEHVYALNGNGEVVWSYQSQVSEWMANHHDYWTMGRKAKVRKILPVDADGDGKLDIFIGTGGAAIERLDENGQPQWLFTFLYGTPMSLLLADVRPDHPGPELIAGTFDVSYDPMVRTVDPATGQELGGAFISRYPAQREGPPKPEPASFAQGNVFMRLPSLGEGKRGLLRAVCGENWNNLVMNDPATGACRWGHSFGPGGGSLGNQLLSGIATPDLNGDGWPDAVVGVRSGWVCAFDGPTGKPLWSRALPSPVTMVVAAGGEGVEEGAAVIAGCEDGRVYRLNRDGQPTHGAVVEGSPTVGVWLGGPEPLCLVGTQSGSLVALSASGA